MDELTALVILSHMPFLDTATLKRKVQNFGSAQEMLNQRGLPGEEAVFDPRTLEKWDERLARSLKNIELADKLRIKIVPYTSPLYPKKLLELQDHPPILYMKGELLNNDARSIAIVGTRQASIYGLEAAEKIAGELAGKGFTVTSGLARGVDTAAHRGALTQGRTVAFIGSGLAHIYPKENISLTEDIAQNGAVLSEFPMDATPEKHHFPKRNRLVSAMTLGTLLIEAPEKSGAMITMDHAWMQKKKLFALPGRVDSDSFKGNHALIKSGRAQLIEDGEDIARCFYDDLFPAMPKQAKPKPALEAEEEMLLNRLPNEELSIESVCELTQLPVMKLNGLLMSLILKQRIKEFPGKVYKKVGV